MMLDKAMDVGRPPCVRVDDGCVDVLAAVKLGGELEAAPGRAFADENEHQGHGDHPTAAVSSNGGSSRPYQAGI
jgi:hypothetical protein